MFTEVVAKRKIGFIECTWTSLERRTELYVL
jgi:hypothetical protein